MLQQIVDTSGCAATLQIGARGKDAQPQVAQMPGDDIQLRAAIHTQGDISLAIEQVVAAAKASGATVILPGNVYKHGTEGGVWYEITPQRPVSRKGHIRMDMEKGYRSSGVQTIILRAGNFVDPEGQDDIMRLFILRDIAKGKITSGGAPDVTQAWCYVPDWARAAEQLARMRVGLSSFEDIPFPGHNFSIDELRTRLTAYQS